MKSRLTDLLTETAGSARDYADGAAAIAAARRDRRRRRVLAAPLAAAVVAALVFVLVRPGGTTSAVTPAAPTLTPPAVAPPFGGKAIGPASMIYTTCPRLCDPLIVGAGGKHYSLPMMYDAADEYTLSPDGGRLGYTSGRGILLHDLSTGRTQELLEDKAGMSEPWAWSPDSLRLLVVRHDDGVVSGFRSIEVRTGAGVAVRTTRSPVAVLDDGTILYWQGEPGRSPLVFADVEGGTLRTVTTRDLGVAAHLRDGEAVLDPVRVAADNSQAMLTVRRPPVNADDVGTPAAVLIVNLGAGRVDERIDLPAGAGLWQPSRLFAASVRVVRLAGGNMQVVDLDRATRAQTVVATVPGGVTVQLPGDAR